MSHYLDRTLDELDPIEKAILRLAVYELQFEPDVPYKVAINEAIEVAKVFGADEAINTLMVYWIKSLLH